MKFLTEEEFFKKFRATFYENLILFFISGKAVI